MSDKFKLTLTAAASLMVLAGATAVQAQEADPSAATEEIVVTAQLRAQDPIEVPFALTAYTGQALQDLGVQEFEELSLFVPGFEVQNQSPNNPGFVMRGITSDSGDATMEPRVSVFQDGVSISKSRGSYVELFDVERVEVAKGPQSTLYGRGALIGAVNVVQKKARPGRFDASIRGSVGDGGYAMFEGMANAPLGDEAAVRFAARVKTRDGYVDNLLGGEDFNAVDTQAFRTAFAWEPTETLSFDVIANWQKDQASGTSFKSRSLSPTDPVTGAVLGGREPWEGAALAPGAGFEGGKPLGLDREVWGVTGLAELELSDSLTLTSITAHRRFDSLEVFDADGASLPILTSAEDAHGEQTSQELRLNYDAGGRWSGFVGGAWFHEDGYQRTPVQFDERMALARLTGALNGMIPGRPASDPAPEAVFGSTAFTGALIQGLVAAQTGGALTLSPTQAQAIAANLRANHVETATNASELTSYDLFGDLTFKPTDRLELSAGVRYTRDDKTTGFSSAVVGAQRSVLGGVVGTLQALGAGQMTLPQALALLGSPATPNTPGALGAPGAYAIPTSAGFPVPQFGLTFQPTAGNGSTVSQDLEDDGFTWRLTARYALSEDASLYANYGRGRRPQVLQAASPSAPLGAVRFTTVDAETVDSVEVGAKTRLMDGRLGLDGAVFHYAYENFQTTVQDGVLFRTVNAGEASAYGFEGQASFAAADNVDLFGTYAYNRSRFDTGLRKGNRFRLSPDHSLSLGASLRFAALGGEFDFRPTYTWQSKVFFDDDNDRSDLQQPPLALLPDNVQDEVQDAYGLLNLRLGYGPVDGAWGVELFVDNVLDQEYVKDAGNTGDGLGLPTFIAGEPRFWGVSFFIRH